MRKSFVGPSMILTEKARRDRSMRGYTGLWRVCKRLERGTFSWPRHVDAGKHKLSLQSFEFGLRRSRAGPNQVHATRQEESRPIIDTIQNEILHLKHCLPKSSPGKARYYMLEQWSRLNAFLEHS